MLVLLLVAVSAGLEFPRNPLPRVHTDAPAGGVRVALDVVGDIDDVIGQGIGLGLHGQFVALFEVFALTDPVEDRDLIRHVFVTADRAQAFSVADTLADLTS